MSKIKAFKQFISEGKTREEARDLSGVSEATSKIQVSQLKKAWVVKTPVIESKENEEVVEDTTIEPVE